MMLILQGATSKGSLVIVGLDEETSRQLADGKPAVAQLPGCPQVLIVAAPDDRSCLAKLVDLQIVGAELLEHYEEPDNGAARVVEFDGDDTAPKVTQMPALPEGVDGEQRMGDTPNPLDPIPLAEALTSAWHAGWDSCVEILDATPDAAEAAHKLAAARGAYIEEATTRPVEMPDPRTVELPLEDLKHLLAGFGGAAPAQRAAYNRVAAYLEEAGIL